MKKLIPQAIKNIYHLAQAALANFLFGFPAKSIKVIGVTGTNGKTTTVQMIARILEEAGKKVAVISTINFKLGEKEWVNKTKFTTLSSFAVQKFILDAVKARCEYLVLETSSHSLDQYRVWGIDYDMAVITNVTREHLDYHKTMDEYRSAKLKLFKNAKAAVVNLDMERPEKFIRAENKIIYGYSAQFPISKSQFPINFQFPNSKFQNVIARNIEPGINDTKFQVQNINFRLHLMGLFNVENALAAICAGLAEDINLETSAKALEKIKNIPGRLEYVSNKLGINIVIDYAVTPDSLEKLYTLIQKTNIEKAKVIAVFGACGERDRGKRPIMGEIVSKYADFIILTNEDLYNEDPWQIINEVASGIKNKTEDNNFWKILDRREAIEKALILAGPGDFVIVTGKGAEETMAIGAKQIPWNDKKVIQELLQEAK